MIKSKILCRRCLKTHCREGDNVCITKPYQISYHIMNHVSPVVSEKVLFKLTLMKSNDLSKAFRLIRGNQRNIFKVILNRVQPTGLIVNQLRTIWLLQRCALGTARFKSCGVVNDAKENRWPCTIWIRSGSEDKARRTTAMVFNFCSFDYATF